MDVGNSISQSLTAVSVLTPVLASVLATRASVLLFYFILVCLARAGLCNWVPRFHGGDW